MIAKKPIVTLVILGGFVSFTALTSSAQEQGRYRRVQDLTKILSAEASQLSQHLGEITQLGRDVHTYRAEVAAIKSDPELNQEQKADQMLELGIVQVEKILGKMQTILKVGENKYVLQHRAQMIRRLIASGTQDNSAQLEKRKEEIRRLEGNKRKDLRRLMSASEVRDLTMEEKRQIEARVRELEALQFEKNLMEKMKVSLETLEKRIGRQQAVILRALDRIDTFFQRYDAFTRNMALKLSYLRIQLENLAIIEDYGELYGVLGEFHEKGFEEISGELDNLNDVFSADLFSAFTDISGLSDEGVDEATRPYTEAAREEDLYRRARTLLDGLN
ncbi:MAG: hypothetical protein H6834_16530 [Planctomycetes bacterium]|nr:hypothetical protein [Planctomycetota bacterium]